VAIIRNFIFEKNNNKWRI